MSVLRVSLTNSSILQKEKMAEEARGNPCTMCTCTGFQPYPNDPAICIAPRAPRPPQGRCQHIILNHPPQSGTDRK